MFFKHIASIQKVLKFKSDVINTHIKCRNSYAEAWLLGLLSSLFSKSGKPLLYIVFQLRMFSFFKTDVLQKQILLHKHFLFMIQSTPPAPGSAEQWLTLVYKTDPCIHHTQKQDVELGLYLLSSHWNTFKSWLIIH